MDKGSSANPRISLSPAALQLLLFRIEIQI